MVIQQMIKKYIMVINRIKENKNVFMINVFYIIV